MLQSEGVGAVGADREQELEKDLVGLDPLSVGGVAVLGADLAELARPISHQERTRLVDESGVVGPIRTIPARACEPPSGELVVEGEISPEGPRRACFLLPPAPDELRAREQAFVDGAAERAITQGGVEPVQLR